MECNNPKVCTHLQQVGVIGTFSLVIIKDYGSGHGKQT